MAIDLMFMGEVAQEECKDFETKWAPPLERYVEQEEPVQAREGRIAGRVRDGPRGMS